MARLDACADADAGVLLGRRIGQVFLLVGILTMVGGGAWLARTAAFVARAEQAPGQIIAIERGSGSKGKTMYRPVFRFRDASGQQHELRSALSSNRLGLSVGEAVTVAYDRTDPAQARIASFGMLWELPLVVFGFGALFTGFSALLLYVWGRTAHAD